MNLEEWKKARAEGEEFTLPSGLDVKLRKVTALDLVLAGSIPTTLYATIDQYISAAGGVDAERFREFEPMVNAVCEACFASPRVVNPHPDPHPDPRPSPLTAGTAPAPTAMGEGVIAVTDLPIEDRLAVFEWANRASGALRKFRAEQDADVGAAQSGEGIQPAA